MSEKNFQKARIMTDRQNPVAWRQGGISFILYTETILQASLAGMYAKRDLNPY